MAIHATTITQGSEQTVTISGATTYDCFGIQLVAPTFAATTTITVKNTDDVTVVSGAYALGFKDNFIPLSPGSTPYQKGSKIDGPIKVTISGSGSTKVNIYYSKRT